jgi:hypothetical protein
MSYEKYQYFILCEDKKHFHFIRAFLESKGAIRQVTLRYGLPDGRGDAKNHINKYYSDAVHDLRSRSNTILIIVRDADTDGYDSVLDSFKDKTNNTFFIIPKRNIETWFCWLDGNEVDEDSDYKLRYKKAKPTHFGKLCAEKITDDCSNAPESLKNTLKMLQERVILG